MHDLDSNREVRMPADHNLSYDCQVFGRGVWEEDSLASNELTTDLDKTVC